MGDVFDVDGGQHALAMMSICLKLNCCVLLASPRRSLMMSRTLEQSWAVVSRADDADASLDDDEAACAIAATK